MSKQNYTPCDPIELIDTTGLTNERWLEIREHGLSSDPTDPDYIPFTITGSGASCALGVNPWTSDEEYRDKKMGISPAISTEFNEENKAAGHVFEPFVAINFMRYMKSNFPDTEVKLIKDCLRDILPYLEGVSPDADSFNELGSSWDKVTKSFLEKWPINPSSMYQCGTKNEDGSLRYPFALANIDGLVKINGKLGIFEAKTTSTRSHAIRDYWEQGKIPPYYYWQLVFYMAVMNVDYAYIACLWGVTLNDMAVVYLERDLAVEEEFMEFRKNFVTEMSLGLPLEESKSDPEVVSQYYYRLFGSAKGTESRAVELPPYARSLVKRAISLDEELKQLEEDAKEVEAKKTALYNELHLLMKDNAYAKIEMEDKSVYGVKLKTSMKKAVFDEERFRNDYPELYEEFSEAKLNLTKLSKSKHKHLKSLYTNPAEPNPEGKASFEIYEYSGKAK
mgnify:FL=1